MFWNPFHNRYTIAGQGAVARFIVVNEPIRRTFRQLASGLILLLRLAMPRAAAGCEGELGGDLAFLREYCTKPESAQETNYYIDLWEGQHLQSIASLNGLTNNHALFINSHGKRSDSGQYVLYPHQSLLSKSAAPPSYSPADLARVLGDSAVSNIHNIVLSACNAEGALSTKEILKAFPNATNVIHSAAGELGYQAMFLQALVNHSSKVKPVYEWAERNERGELEYLTGPAPYRNSKRFAPYVAELFTPGSTKPFAVQRAGRELLEPQRFGKSDRAAK